MASKNQMTGMLGVYLVAAELTRRGLVVSPTSRSAAGADLLVTDQECQHAWSVQVKTNSKRATYWLLNKAAGALKSASHIYVFVNLNGDERPDYLVVPSKTVALTMRTFKQRTGSIWYAFDRRTAPVGSEGWEAFGISG